jgi:hypothetical protein
VLWCCGGVLCCGAVLCCAVLSAGGEVGLEFVRNTALELWSSPLLVMQQQEDNGQEDVLDYVI